MNLILDRLPDSVWINGAEYPIQTDFRVSILFGMALQDEGLEPERRILEGLSLYFPVIPDDVESAMEAAVDFYRCGQPAPESVESGPALFSFEHDAPYIYAAFMQQYDIDLTTVKLHWWKFHALFCALPSDTLFGKILGWRGTEISYKMPREQRESLERLKAYYALPCPQSEIERHNMLEAALLGDGNLSKLIKKNKPA